MWNYDSHGLLETFLQQFPLYPNTIASHSAPDENNDQNCLQTEGPDDHMSHVSQLAGAPRHQGGEPHNPHISSHFLTQVQLHQPVWYG